MEKIIFFLSLWLGLNLIYPLIKRDFNFLQSFDNTILYFLFFALISRILGIVTSPLELGFSLNPLSEADGVIVLFGNWPWIILRIWDGIFELRLLGLIAILSALALFPFFGKLKDRFASLLANFFTGLLITNTLLLISNLVLGTQLGAYFNSMLYNLLLIAASIGVVITHFYLSLNNISRIHQIFPVLAWVIISLIQVLPGDSYFRPVNYYVIQLLLLIISLFVVIFSINLNKLDTQKEIQKTRNFRNRMQRDKINYKEFSRNTFSSKIDETSKLFRKVIDRNKKNQP